MSLSRSSVHPRWLPLALGALLLQSGIGLAQGKPRFVRGDANTDEQVDLSDSISIIFGLFGDGERLPCLEGADANADEKITISDPIYILEYLFRNAGAPPPPYPICAEPEDEPVLGCEESPCPGPACSIRAHGCVVEGVECPVFRTDGGGTLELTGGEDLRPPPVGWCGTIIARPCKGCASFCMQGQIVVLCGLIPDGLEKCSIRIHGMAIRGVECVVFRTDAGETYELVGGPPEVRQIGWSGAVTARPRPDLMSFCMQGQIVEVCSAVPDSPGPVAR